MRINRPQALMSCALAVVLAGAVTGAQAPGKPITASASVTLPAATSSLAAINGSALVAAGMVDGKVAVWNGRDAAPSLIMAAHTVKVLAVGSSADGRALWSLDKDGLLVRTPFNPAVEATTPEPSSSRRLDIGAERVVDAVFSSDAAMLVTGGEHGELRVFDSASGVLRQQIRAHRTEVQALAVRPGSSIVASASAEADLRIWDMARGVEASSVDGIVSLFALKFSPVDGTLASGGVDRRLTLRDPSTFKELGHVALPAPKMVSALAWSPDGRSIAVGDIDDATLSKGGIEVLDAVSRAVICRLDTSGMPASAVVFAAERTVIAVGATRMRAWTVPATRPSRR